MKTNVGGIDKILRIGAGVGLVAWALLGGPAWRGSAWCRCHRPDRLLPAYPLLGMSTCPTKKDDDRSTIAPQQPALHRLARWPGRVAST